MVHYKQIYVYNIQKECIMFQSCTLEIYILLTNVILIDLTKMNN